MKPAPTCTLRIWPGQLVATRFERKNLLSRTANAVASRSHTFDDSASLARALPHLLQDFCGSAHKVSVVVSDSLCRYLSLSRPTGTASLRELEALGQARFHAAFGDDPNDWVITADRPVRGQHDLLVAIPRLTLSALQEGLRSAGLQATNIVPFWVRCANATPPQRRASHWVVASEPTGHTVGLFENGHCQGVRRVRRGANDALHEVLARETPFYENAASAQRAWLWGLPPRIASDGLPSGFDLVKAGLPPDTPDLAVLPGANTTQVPA